MITKKFEPFENTVWLSSPTKHREVLDYITEAYESNWMSTIGKNIDEIERTVAEKVGCDYAVALSSGTSALHLCMILAMVKKNMKVFCSDMTFDATVNPVVYEGGIPIFIDSEYETWNMDPIALEKAFELYPDVKLVVIAHLYGTPGKLDEIRAICDKHGAKIVEDAAESFGASYKGKQTGSFGDFSVLSFNGNKVITGSSGGMFLTNSAEDAMKVRKLSTQSRENALWYQHKELGYNYRMSNVIAGVIRGQLPYLDEHIAQKKSVWERYRDGLSEMPLSMNPMDLKNSEPNHWLSCVIIDKDKMCKQHRGDCEAEFVPEHGKTCPTEMFEALAHYNAQARPIWKPMHMQPIYKDNDFINRFGKLENSYDGDINPLGADGKPLDISRDIFDRGLCLTSDNKMTVEEQDKIIDIIKACFD